MCERKTAHSVRRACVREKERVREWVSVRVYVSVYICVCAECVCVARCTSATEPLQGGENSQDTLICMSFSAKEPLIIELFCGK